MEFFKRLRLNRWRQFESVDLEFDGNICVLTGPNGCGKTTILNVLGKHFGWNLAFLSASFLSNKERKRIHADSWEAIETGAEGAHEIGTILYSNDVESRISAPTSNQAPYQLKYLNQQKVEGLHIPSHRPPPGYHRVQQIPIDPKTSQQHYQEYQNFLFSSYNEQPQKNPATAMKETLIAFAVFGEGNSSVQTNQEYQNVFRGFQDILRQLLPEHIGFQSIEISTPDVILRTTSGPFPLESMSGGLNALFGIAWQIHTYGFDKSACTVLIDEPENHLHPSMQREFLPRLGKAFPSYKFIVSSHSPFVVSSTPDAAVYALVYNDSGRVVSRRLTEVDLSGSPNAVLREILDVPVTMPIWVERRIDSVLAKFAGKAANQDTVADIRAELEAQGLNHALGDYLGQRRRIAPRTESAE